MQTSLAQFDGLAARVGGHVYSAQTKGVHQPSPKFYSCPARKLQVPPGRCVVIDDGLLGLRAALAALAAFAALASGMRAICFVGNPARAPLAAERAALADYDVALVSDMAGLPGLMGL